MMIAPKLIILNGLIFCFTFISSVSYGETLEEKGLRIMTAMEQRDDGWVGLTADVEMVFGGKKEADYKFHIRLFEKPDDGYKGMIIYSYPSDMKGVISMVHLHRYTPSDMWIFIPSNKRVKRFSSQKKNSSFLGSPFTSEDLNRGEIERYTYRWVRNETYEGLPCSVVDRFPVEDNSGYKNERFWIEQREYRILKIEYYNMKDVHIKTQYFNDYKKYLDYFWREGSRTMVNEKTGARTTLFIKNWKLNLKLNENDFLPTRLKKLR
jgi:outer membrane lipoprotein-sorting protein